MASVSSSSSLTSTDSDDSLISRDISINIKRKNKLSGSYDEKYKRARTVRSTGECVSSWKLHNLEKMGISYWMQPLTFSDILERIVKYGFESLSSSKRNNLESLVELVKQRLTTISFDIRRRENTAYSRGVLEECIEVSQEIQPIWEKLVAEGNISWKLGQVLVHLQNFCEQFTLFLQARCQENSKPPEKANYRTLLASFVKIFLLRPKQGDELENVSSINGMLTPSAADLRIVNVGSLRDIERNISLCVVDVFESKCKCTGKSDLENFNIHSSVPDGFLAQHSGDLLLEYRNTQYANHDCVAKVVLGIICLETTLIFTCLELSDTHFAKIKDNSDIDIKDNQRNDSGTIFYTKPYNYLVKEDREQILEFLFTLSMQSEKNSL